MRMSLAVNSETGELLDADVECPLDSTAEGEPYCVCPNGVHCTVVSITVHQYCTACLG